MTVNSHDQLIRGLAAELRHRCNRGPGFIELGMWRRQKRHDILKEG